MTLRERFDTTFNVQNLLTAIIIAAGLIAYANHLEGRVSRLEEFRVDQESFKHAQELIDRRQDEEANRRQDQILEALKDLGSKVDKIRR